MQVNIRLSILLMIAALIAPVLANAQFEKITTLSHPEVLLAAVDRPGDLHFTRQRDHPL